MRSQAPKPEFRGRRLCRLPGFSPFVVPSFQLPKSWFTPPESSSSPCGSQGSVTEDESQAAEVLLLFSGNTENTNESKNEKKGGSSDDLHDDAGRGSDSKNHSITQESSKLENFGPLEHTEESLNLSNSSNTRRRQRNRSGKLTTRKKSKHNPIFEVEKIVDSRIIPSGNTEYLLRWKGFSSEHDSWVSEDCVENGLQELLEEYLSEINEK